VHPQRSLIIGLLLCLTAVGGLVSVTSGMAVGLELGLRGSLSRENAEKSPLALERQVRPRYSSSWEALLADFAARPPADALTRYDVGHTVYTAHAGLPVHSIPPVQYRYPLDTGRQWRMSAQICPGFLPEIYPGRSWDEMCGQCYLTSPWLEQRGWANPFRIAAEEVQRCNQDKDAAWQRALLAAAYWWTYRDHPTVGEDTLLAALGRQQYQFRELLVEHIAPKVVALLPAMITEVAVGEHEVAVDLRVESNTSFDSTTSVESLLLHAAKRGLGAVVIADRNRIDGAQRAQRIADRLQAAGKLPVDFRVIIGEYIDTTSGGVLGLFLNSWVPEGMTMGKTVEMIHDHDGLAVLAHPGVAGGPRVLRQMPFDGYLIQADFFEMFRTLQILYDPQLAHKPALYASNSPYGAVVGLPFTAIEASDNTTEGLRRALAEGRAYAAGGTYLPWMMASTMKPIGQIETMLNHYFVGHDKLEEQLQQLVKADNVILRTSWDRELQGWMGLGWLGKGIRQIGDHSSPLLGLPRLERVALEYSYFQLSYSNDEDLFSVRARYIW